MSPTPSALYANLSAYNRWYDEAWGFNYEDRIYATALLSLRDLDRAVALTDEIVARGAKVVLLPTGPAYGRSPADPYFDPVWSRLAEAGVVIALHIMPFWYFDALSPAWGHDPDPASWHMSAWQWMNVYGERPVVDTLSALIFDNLFGRFPRLNVLVAEHGASWVPHTLRHLDKSRGMGRNGPWIGGPLRERPSEIFKRHVRVTPYPEDDIPKLVEELGGDDRVLVFGSDFPHAEGVARPADFEQLLDFPRPRTCSGASCARTLRASSPPCDGRSTSFAWEAEHPLADHVALDLGRTGEDRLGPREQELVLAVVDVSFGRHQAVGTQQVHAELPEALVPRGPVQLPHRGLGPGGAAADQLRHRTQAVPPHEHQPDVGVGQPLAERPDRSFRPRRACVLQDRLELLSPPELLAEERGAPLEPERGEHHLPAVADLPDDQVGRRCARR